MSKKRIVSLSFLASGRCLENINANVEFSLKYIHLVICLLVMMRNILGLSYRVFDAEMLVKILIGGSLSGSKYME